MYSFPLPSYFGSWFRESECAREMDLDFCDGHGGGASHVWRAFLRVGAGLVVSQARKWEDLRVRRPKRANIRVSQQN